MSFHQLELFADYFQFYIQDELADGDLSDAWTEEAVERFLAVAPGIVGVGTVRNMTVPVSIEILDSEAKVDAEDFDHIVECSIAIKSGRLVAAGCTDYLPDAKRIEVSPGTYRVLVCFEALDSLSEDGLEGGDKYHLRLWPASAVPVAIIKQRA